MQCAPAAKLGRVHTPLRCGAQAEAYATRRDENSEEGGRVEDRPSIGGVELSWADRSYRSYGFFSSGILEPSVAQPPLPLQLFLPLQPLSLLLQPPLPLQEFWPLQACFSTFFESSFLSCVVA